MKKSGKTVACGVGVALALWAGGSASAQHGGGQAGDHTGMTMPSAESEASAAYMAAMDEMMRQMESMAMSGDAATDFARMMIPHHQSAIDMAQAYLEHGDDPQLTELAGEIIAAQREEIETLENWLAEHGQR
jgi:uncharacterized protein (DUF305 family)